MEEKATVTIVSRHASKRVVQRVGGHKKSVQRIADRAFQKGVCFKDAKINDRIKMADICHDNIDLEDLRLYGNHLYIFDPNRVLVTVIPWK